MIAAEAVRLLGTFALGYAAVLAAPGPNMLAIGAMAALRGFRGALPFCVGIACGAAVLSLSLLMAFGTLGDTHDVEVAGRAIGGALLLWVALRIARSRAPAEAAGPGAARPRGDALAGFGAGFGTAVTNPVTAAYLAAQLLGPLAGREEAPLVIGLVLVQALLVGLLVAGLFAQPAARRMARAHHRALSAVSAAALGALGVAMLSPLLLA
jgi:threonine/homoserine/homoserine lactone efflux protein